MPRAACCNCVPWIWPLLVLTLTSPATLLNSMDPEPSAPELHPPRFDRLSEPDPVSA